MAKYEKIYYVYGPANKASDMIACFVNAGAEFNVMKALSIKGNEYEITVKNEEIEPLGYCISNIKGCWMQEDRKTDFLEPSKPFIKQYATPVVCTQLETTTKIIYDAILYSDAPNCAFATSVSVESACVDKFAICGGSNVKILEFEMVDLAGLYYMRANAGTPDILKIKGILAQ